ncbi:hypothetical protein ES702_01926 [subsurface metagenome]
MPFGFNFLHRLLDDVHTPHYFNEIALVGNAADKPSGANAKDNMLFYEQDTGLWKRYRSALSEWVLVAPNMQVVGYDYEALVFKNLAIDPATKALKIKQVGIGDGDGGVTTFVALTDTPGSYAEQALKGLRVKAGEDGLEFVTLDGGGVTTFVALTDTPSSYEGQATKYPRVKASEDGLEFVAGTGDGVTTFVALTDTPSSYEGQGGKTVRVKSAEDGLEFIAGGNGGGVRGFVFNLGAIIVGTKFTQALVPSSFTISKVKIYSDTAPTGASIIVDVNKNGTTIFTDQGKRPEIAISGHADDSDTPDITSLTEGNRLSVDIDQVGSTIPGGNDLLVTVLGQ